LKGPARGGAFLFPGEIGHPEEARENELAIQIPRADEGTQNARIALAGAGAACRWQDPAILSSFGRARYSRKVTHRRGVLF
jgi:hypothetical protein